MKASTGRCAVDANVLLRFLLSDHAELSPKARTIINSIQAGDLTVFCDPVILAEVVWVLKSVYKVPPQEIAARLQPLLTADGFHVPDKDRYVHALELYGTSRSHFGDACACAAALERCGGRLLSFDRKLSDVEGLDRREEV